jgi:hypothetical protein
MLLTIRCLAAIHFFGAKWLELHIFFVAPVKAFSAVAYIRVTSREVPQHEQRDGELGVPTQMMSISWNFKLQ